MLVGITGLHGAGKSYFCNTIPPKFGFKVFSKKQELAKIYKNKTGRDDWINWYRREYEKDPKKVTEFILLGVNKSENVIFDAVHSPLEWQIIKDNFPNTELIEIVTPESIRLQRINTMDIAKDKKELSIGIVIMSVYYLKLVGHLMVLFQKNLMNNYLENL